MPERARLELGGAAMALLVCAAFVASFAFGLGGADVGRGEEVAETRPVTVPAPAGRIEVLNASSRSGMARAATEQLRDAGFDVVYFGNAPSSAGDSSAVLARRGTDEVAQAAGRAIRIRRIRTEPDTSLFLDATVIIGVDWMPDPEADPAREDGLRARLGRWLKGER